MFEFWWVLLLTIAVPAVAAPFPSSALLSVGYTELGPADLDRETAARRGGSDDMAVSADLTGDGHVDEARFFRNREGKLVLLVGALTPVKLDTYILRPPPGTIDQLRIRLAAPGIRYVGKDGDGISTTVPTLTAISDSGDAMVYAFDGEEFEAFVTTDPAVLNPDLKGTAK